MVPREWLFEYGIQCLSLSQERNSQYVVLVEVYLAKAFSTDPAEDGDDLMFVLFSLALRMSLIIM